MNSSSRLIINTIAQNIRTVLNILISLITTRVVMNALGQSDYGIYMLVAGIVSLLSYLNNTLVITTQRYICYSLGARCHDNLKLTFANSYLLHWLIGLVLSLGCLFLTSFIFKGYWLNIPYEKIYEAEFVYFMVVGSVLITFITAPYRALLISHENIVYISVIEIFGGVLKLILVFSLYLFDEWRLGIYSTMLLGIMAFNFICFSAYCCINYKESVVIPRISQWRLDVQRKIIGFASWTLYGMICIYVRNQGYAVVLNRMLGTIANAAYGVALQIFGSIQFISQSVLNSITPQLMQAEGAGDRSRSVHMAYMACKYSFLMLSLFSLPLLFEMPTLLHFWLGKVPAYTVILVDMLIIASLFDQITIGIGKLNQAIGNIRNYTLITFSIKVLALPLMIICFKTSLGITGAAFCFVFIELASAMARLFFVRNSGFHTKEFVQQVLSKIAIPLLSEVTLCILVTTLVSDYSWRLLLSVPIAMLGGGISIFMFSMTKDERNTIFQLLIKRNP